MQNSVSFRPCFFGCGRWDTSASAEAWVCFCTLSAIRESYVHALSGNMGWDAGIYMYIMFMVLLLLTCFLLPCCAFRRPGGFSRRQWAALCLWWQLPCLHHGCSTSGDIRLWPWHAGRRHRNGIMSGIMAEGLRGRVVKGRDGAKGCWPLSSN